MINDENSINKLGSQKEDIYLRANFLSRMFFYWAYKVIKLANLTHLKTEYLGILEGKNLSKIYSRDLEDVWEKKNYKNLSSNALLKASMRANLINMIIVFFITLFCTILEIINVYLFRIFIKLYQIDYVPPNEYFTKLNIGITFILIKLVNSFLWREFGIFQNLIGYKATAELNCMIYNKVLRASCASFKHKSGEGEIVNYLQVDAAKLAFVFTSSPWLLVDPIKLFIYIYMLFEFMGVAFIYGFFTLIIFILING